MAIRKRKSSARPAKRIEVFKNNSEVVTNKNAWNFRRMYNAEVLFTGRGYDRRYTALLMARRRSEEMKVPVAVIVID